MSLNKATLIAILVGSLILASCASFVDPHENFKNHMRSDVGNNIDDRHTWAGPHFKPIEARELPNGNTENKYEFRGTCRYFFEFDPETRIIVDWRFEGSKEDCVINP